MSSDLQQTSNDQSRSGATDFAAGQTAQIAGFGGILVLTIVAGLLSPALGLLIIAAGLLALVVYDFVQS